MEYFKNRFIAFKYAFSGLAAAFKNEVHLKLYLFIALIVIGLAFYFGVSKTEWLELFACITLVITLEMFNSAIEKLCDLVMPDKHPKIKYIKDVMAGAVLLACVFAAIVGVMVFMPYLKGI